MFPKKPPHVLHGSRCSDVTFSIRPTYLTPIAVPTACPPPSPLIPYLPFPPFLHHQRTICLAVCLLQCSLTSPTPTRMETLPEQGLWSVSSTDAPQAFKMAHGRQAANTLRRGWLEALNHTGCLHATLERLPSGKLLFCDSALSHLCLQRLSELTRHLLQTAALHIFEGSFPVTAEPFPVAPTVPRWSRGEPPHPVLRVWSG